MARRPARLRSNQPAGIFSRLLRALQLLAARTSKIALKVTRKKSPKTMLVADMAAQLRANERIWAGFRDLELRMLAANSLHEILEVLTRDLPRGFPAVRTVTIAWNNPDSLIEHIDTEPARAAARRCLVRNRSSDSVPETRRVYLGPVPPGGQKQFFPAFAPPLGSMAIVPMFLRGEHVGSLNQGSDEPAHFNPEVATDLLEHLAAVTAICIDNAINRARLAHQGLTDGLTNVGNRRFFEQRLREEVSLWQRRGGDLSCLLVDLDHFKQINDQHGHQVGDLVLQQAARLFSQGLRASDVLARYGGEEFALLLPATDAARAFEIAERLRIRLAGTRITPSPETVLQVTASIGLASLGGKSGRRTSEPGVWLLQHADAALYAAKARGRNCVAGPEALADAGSSDIKKARN